MDGWIYTIHLHRPLGRGGRNGAIHYTGWANDDGLLTRLKEHRGGYGSRMMAWCKTAGITWHVGHLQRGTRTDERLLKNHGHHERRCWTCKANHDG